MRTMKRMRRVQQAIFGSLMMLLSLVVLPASVLADDSPAAGDLGRGAKAWADNCARCHNMRDPKEFRDDVWRPIVYHMRVRAGLTGQDTRDILAYLRAAN